MNTHTFLSPSPPPRLYEKTLDIIITRTALSLLRFFINQVYLSFNRWAQLHTPEYHLSPWATTIRRNITSNLLILPKFRFECIMSGFVCLYFYCMLNHCPLNLEMSLNCQEAVIYFSDIWISLASPFNFSIIQYRVRDKEREGRNTALVVWCAFMPLMLS